MAGLFEGIAPPNIETTRSTAQQAPQYLTDYLTKLATEGPGMLGKTGQELIAPMSDLQKSAYTQAPALLGAYQSPLDEALKAGKSAMGVSPEDISRFYDPFQQQVIDEMQKQSDINLQRSVLPGLKALGVSGGQFRGSRVGDISGQALADIAANLQAKQTGARSAGFKTALDAALREQGQQVGATSALGQLGATQAAAGLGEAKGLADLGGQQTAYEQSKLEAPLTRAANVAQLLRGYSYPTTTAETYKGPGTVYGPSVFSQIAGLGSLIGAAFPQGGGGFGNILKDIITGSKKEFPEIAYPGAPVIEKGGYVIPDRIEDDTSVFDNVLADPFPMP